MKISKKIKDLEGLRAGSEFIESHPAQALYNKAVHLLGFPFDGTACFRKGAVLGPEELRKASDNLETYSPYLQKNLEDRLIIDLGDLPSSTSWEENTDFMLENFKGLSFENHRLRLLTLGGEHSISYAPIRLYLEQYPDLVLLHLDAHADLRDGYQGYKFSHASIIRRALDHFTSQHKLIQYGIRSGTEDEFRYMEENETRCHSRTDFLERVEALDKKRPIYLTLDLDYFDPAYMPGTGTVEAGGEDFHSFISLMKILSTKNFVGADCVELAPEIDPTGNSNCFASKVVREIILALKN